MKTLTTKLINLLPLKIAEQVVAKEILFRELYKPQKSQYTEMAVNKIKKVHNVLDQYAAFNDENSYKREKRKYKTGDGVFDSIFQVAEDLIFLDPTLMKEDSKTIASFAYFIGSGKGDIEKNFKNYHYCGPFTIAVRASIAQNYKEMLNDRHEAYKKIFGDFFGEGQSSEMKEIFEDYLNSVQELSKKYFNRKTEIQEKMEERARELKINDSFINLINLHKKMELKKRKELGLI